MLVQVGSVYFLSYFAAVADENSSMQAPAAAAKRGVLRAGAAGSYNEHFSSVSNLFKRDCVFYIQSYTP